MIVQAPPVTPVSAVGVETLAAFLHTYGLTLSPVAAGTLIPASYWGESECGVIGRTLYARSDTPVHSVLHTASHVLCMNEERRQKLHTDCGGSDPEEEAVCYLQCLLAEKLPGYSRAQVFADMDAWGYHFIAGSAQAWFERDSVDAQRWLKANDRAFIC